MEKESLITKEDILRLSEEAKNGKVNPEEMSIVYSDFIGRGDVPALELLPVKVPGMKATYEFTEYTSMCAKMKQPDFGSIAVTIIPNDSTIEMRSLRNYFIAFREIDIFQEELCANALIDIVKACSPRFCQVRGFFTPRGAMTTEAVFTYHE